MNGWYVFKTDSDDDLQFVKRLWYRLFCRIGRNVKSVPWEIKYFIQRGLRGWSDKDVWSLDNYIEHILSGGLLHLADTTHGHPCRDQNPQPDGMPGCALAGLDCTCEALWDTDLRKYAAMFKRLSEEDYWYGYEDSQLQRANDEEDRDDKEAWEWLGKWHGALWD